MLATDWAAEALEVTVANAERNGRRRSRRRSFPGTAPQTLIDRGPWDLVLGADLLYERRNVDQLLGLLPRLGGEILLAEPGRPPAARFFEEVALDVEPLDEPDLPAHSPGPVSLRGPAGVRTQTCQA